MPKVPNFFPDSAWQQKPLTLQTVCLEDAWQGGETGDLNLTWCPLASPLLLGPSSSPPWAKHVCACLLWGRQGFSARVLNARVSQRTLPKRPNPKYITMATIILMVRRSGAWGTHCPPPVGKRALLPREGARTAQPPAAPSPDGEWEDSVISFPQLLLRNSRPSGYWPQDVAKYNLRFSNRKLCLSGGFAGERMGPEGLCQSP